MTLSKGLARVVHRGRQTCLCEEASQSKMGKLGESDGGSKTCSRDRG